MFDAVRNNKRIVQVFLALITLPFAFWGVDSYVRSSGAGDDLAQVGDLKVTSNEFQQAMRDQQEQMKQAMGPNFNPAMLQTPAARRAMLEQIINQKLLMQEAVKRHIVISDATLSEFIAKAPPFQVDGKFSLDRYRAFVQSQGKSEQGFEYELRQDLILRQLAGAVGESSILAKASTDLVKGVMAEKRTVQEYRLAPDAFLASAKVGEDELQKYYEANRKEFEVPEQVRLEYVTLSMDGVKAQIKVSDADVKARYEGQKERYMAPEERRASHILISADKGNADARQKAKAKAEELLATVKAKPADFGKLAKENSQDPGSAAQNGDLGFFGKGMMVKPFEDAVFALKQGDISGVVESDFGYHIIQLTGTKAAQGRGFEEVRAEIEADLKQQAAQKAYAEAAESFANTVYEQADSLKPVVEKFKLTVEQSNWIIKGAPVQPGSPFANPKLAGAVFSDDVTKNKRNTEAVEVKQNTLVAARALEHKPAALKPLESVKQALQDKLLRKQASEAAVKAGETKLAELQQGKDAGVTWTAAQTVSRMAPQGLGQGAMKVVFAASSKSLPAYVGSALPAGGYAVYKLTAVDRNAVVDGQMAGLLEREVREAVGQEEMNAYLNALRAKYKVEVNPVQLEAKNP